MRRVLLICNPAAARTRPRTQRRIIQILEGEGCSVQVFETTGPGDAKVAAHRGATDGVDVVAVYGGDGTVMQAVGGIVGHDVDLALIPGGTGNLLAQNLGISRRPTRAARLAARGEPRHIDLGAVDRPDGRQFFAVASGAGYDAEIMAGTTAAAKRRWGMGAYVGFVLRTMRRVSPIPYRITVDDRVLNVDATTVVVANCRRIVPPVLSLARGVVLDDGYLDVVILSARGVVEAVRVVWRILRGKTNGGGVRYERGRSVTVEPNPVRHVQMDGDVHGVTPFTATVQPGGLRVLVPATPHAG